jgi:pyridoxal/pyridoxine/pyridoxamine kinase
MGDTDQGWYVPKELLPIYCDKILPLAKLCIPNQVG